MLCLLGFSFSHVGLPAVIQQSSHGIPSWLVIEDIYANHLANKHLSISTDINHQPPTDHHQSTTNHRGRPHPERPAHPRGAFTALPLRCRAALAFTCSNDSRAARANLGGELMTGEQRDLEKPMDLMKLVIDDCLLLMKLVIDITMMI